MHRFLCFWILLVLPLLALPAPAQDSHLKESGLAAMLSRSAFAHGYLHGYERSYHQGNLDANMARPPKIKMSQFKGVRRGYDSRFGPKKSFDLGFIAGVRAGYGDGYYGRIFRAMSQLREAGSALAIHAPPDDPAGLNFDTGMAVGYHQGFDNAISDRSGPRHVDFHAVICPQSPSAQPQDSTGEEDYCEGYRRGFVLGHTDGAAFPPGRRPLEASE